MYAQRTNALDEEEVQSPHSGGDPFGKLTLRQFRTVHGEQLLSVIARDTGLGCNSLKHIKSFLSGVFKQSKRLGILDGINPMQDVSIPRTREPGETYAYSLDEVKKMLAVLGEPTRTVVLTAAN